MSQKRKRSETSSNLSRKKNKVGHSEPEIEVDEYENHIDMVFIPDQNDSGDSGDESEYDDDENEEMESDFIESVPHSYRQVADSYDQDQTKLEESHQYNWVNGEKIYNDAPSVEVLLSEKDRKNIVECTPVELFELFFSKELKNYILEATKENGLDLSLEEFDVFIGFLIFSSFNKRSSERDYWKKHPLLKHQNIADAMSRNKYQTIKSKIKFHKQQDFDQKDKVSRVRPIVNIFRKNIKKFGIFATALSVDEMMCKFFGRSSLKQFIKMKPTRYGIKIWALCSSTGYIFEFEIYCGKNSDNNDALSKCALGSRVVIRMLQSLLLNKSSLKLSKYHIYFDNLFSSPDLLVHLNKYGLRATGTVRENRIKAENRNVIQKDAPRGTFEVQHDKNSGLNYITLKDSKVVSVLSTAAGVSPQSSANRWNKELKCKTGIPFPHAFSIYNKFMGGVDIHDMYCNRVMPSIRSKKWTWVIFTRIIQASITNALVLWNTACEKDRKSAVKEFAVSIADNYLIKKSERSNKHVISNTTNYRYCSKVRECGKRTYQFCKICNAYFCATCFQKYH